MAEIAFLRADGDAAENGGGGAGFGDVAVFGGGAVAADVADGIGRQIRVFQRQLDAAAHGGFFGAGDVAAVAVGAVADDFGDDVGAARAGVFQLFEHHHAAAFAQHQAVARGIVGARGERCFAVAAAGGVQGVEHEYFRRTQLVGAAGEHHRDFAEFNGFVGIADALAAGSAGAGSGNQAAGQAEENRHVGGGGVRHHAYIGVGAEVVGLVGEHQTDVEYVGGAAGRRAGGHAHAAVADGRVAEQAGLLERLFGGVGAVLRQRPHAAQLLARPMRRRRVIGNRRAEFGFQLGIAFPSGDVAHGVFAGGKTRADVVPSAAESAHRADAGNHHPFGLHQHSPPFTAITWRVM